MIKYRILHLVLFLLVFLVVNSCRYTKEIRQLEKKEGCEGVITFIENNWSYNESKDIYNYTDEFYNKFKHNGEYRHCIIGLKKEDVIRLFGKPSEKELLFGYFNDTQCKNKHGHCIGTQIKFNKESKVDYIDFIGWGYGSH